MKRNSLGLVIAAIVLTLSSCKKVWDYVKDHPDGTADNCSIDKIYFSENYYDLIKSEIIVFNDTANFLKNSAGLLTSVEYASTKHNLMIAPGDEIGLVFTYDANGRLEGFFNNTHRRGNSIFVGAEGHRYVYVNSKTIIDSLAPWASEAHLDDNGRIVYMGDDMRYQSTITLDDYGRVIKEVFADGRVVSYNYNSQGNLTIPGVTYTSKKSIYQTNKAFMFVNRNYSVNTPVGYASQFNSNELPVKFNSGRLPFFTQKANFQRPEDAYENQNIRVKYLCK